MSSQLNLVAMAFITGLKSGWMLDVLVKNVSQILSSCGSHEAAR